MVHDFSSAFNTIQPNILKDELTQMRLGSSFVSWIPNSVQFVRLVTCVSGPLRSSMGDCPGSFHTLTADFKYNSESCHIQDYSDDTEIRNLNIGFC